jgi:selenoprotein W-related protein
VVDLLKNFEPEIESITLVPSDGGRFELTVNGKLLYSKLSLGRHAAPGEGVDLVRTFLQEGK